MAALPYIIDRSSNIPYVSETTIIPKLKRGPTDDVDQRRHKISKLLNLADLNRQFPDYEPSSSIYATPKLPDNHWGRHTHSNNIPPNVLIRVPTTLPYQSKEHVPKIFDTSLVHTEKVLQDWSKNSLAPIRQTGKTDKLSSSTGLIQQGVLCQNDKQYDEFQPDRHPVRLSLGWHRQERVFFKHPERLPQSYKEQKQATPVPEGVRIIGWKGTFSFGRMYLGFKTNRGLYTWLDKTVAEDMQYFVSDVLSPTQGYSRVERARNVFGLLDKCMDAEEEVFKNQVQTILQSERVVITYNEFIQPTSPLPALQDIRPSDIDFDMCLLAVMYKIMERSPERFVERQGCFTPFVLGHSLEDWFRCWTACRLFRIRRRPSQLTALLSKQGPSKEEDLDCFGYRK